MGRHFAKAMSPEELREARETARLDKKSMALSLGWPYRTYQDREYGRRGIPQDAADQVHAVVRRQAEIMEKIKAGLRAR